MATAPALSAPPPGPKTGPPTHASSASVGGTTGITASSEYTTDDHLISVEDLAAKFSTSLHSGKPRESKGLSNVEAAARLARDGPNALTPPPVVPLWLKFLIKLANPFLVMLNCAGVLSVICYLLDTTQPMNL